MTALIPAARPNWGSEVSLEYQFRTAVLVSRNGTEQRIALRQNPRVSMQYEGILKADRVRRLFTDLAKNLDKLFAVPMRWKNASIASTGPGTITLDAVPHWAFVGANVVLANDMTEEASEITAINGTTLTVSYTITDPTTVYAASTGRYQGSLSIQAETDSVMTAGFQFDLDPGQVVSSASITVDSFESIDVFPFSPNWRDGVEIEFTSERETMDPGVGTIDVLSPWSYVTETMQFRLSFFTADAVDEMLAFFFRQKGKRGQFWVPSDRSDLKSIGDFSAGATEIEVVSSDLATYLSESPVYNVVRIGDQIVRVTDMAAGSTGTVLTLAQATTSDVNSSTKISWCPLCRFAADRLEVVWSTDSVAEVVVPVRTLTNDGGS